MHKSVLQDFPNADISVSIVWIDMLPLDGEKAARQSAQIFGDRRVQQFHDPRRRAGSAFAEGLLNTGPAWDIYLFYEPGEQWIHRPPSPVEWMHQLGGRDRADPHRRRTGNHLRRELHAVMAHLSDSGN